METDEQPAQHTKMICITCPMGCRLDVTHEGQTVLEVTGSTCQRGAAFAQSELSDPRRMVATTVRVRGGVHPLAPVYTAAPFPKPMVRALVVALRAVELQAPVGAGQVVMADALGTGVDVLASRDLPAASA
jgi:CxxC motif-containing protein